MFLSPESAQKLVPEIHWTAFQRMRSEMVFSSTFPKCSLSSGKLGGELVNLASKEEREEEAQLPQLTVLINLTLQCIK